MVNFTRMGKNSRLNLGECQEKIKGRINLFFARIKIQFFSSFSILIRIDIVHLLEHNLNLNYINRLVEGFELGCGSELGHYYAFDVDDEM